MKTKYTAVAIGAVAVILVLYGRAVSKEPSSVDDGLAAMTAPGAIGTTVIEPRDTSAVVPDSTPLPVPAARRTTRAPAAKTVPTRTPTRSTSPKSTATPAPTPATTPTPDAAPAPVVVPARVPPPVAGRLTLRTGSRLWFDGTSSVKDFTCKTSTLEATVVTSRTAAASAIIAGEKSVSGAELTVPVASLDCANGTMNGHMRKALDANAHPTIVFSLRSYELMKGTGSVAITLTGTLTISGTTKPITLLAEATDGADGALRLTGMYELDMKEFGVKPPSLMLGTMNVREKVKVRFDLLLED